MLYPSRLLLTLALFVAVGSAPTLAALPSVKDVDFKRLRADCERLLQALEALKAPLPEKTRQALKRLLANGNKDTDSAAAQVQKLLDPYCLVGVNINPESRVKVARGPAEADLLFKRETIVLIKVHNEAGVTQGLKIAGPQLRLKGRADSGRWLDAVVHTERPLRKTLGGNVLEYVVLGLTAHEAGKREATLQFDVGQGTQDLGFRAEVPILFKVRAGK
jgi:hypothetical protein